MAVLKATRATQSPQYAQFKFTITDTMLDIAGVSKAFSAAAPVMDVINLPMGAIVVGGDVTVETVSNDSSTATIAVGDSSTANRYLTATSIKSAARTALVPTGFRNTSGLNLRITLANAGGDATAGVVTVRVLFIIDGRADEVYPN